MADPGQKEDPRPSAMTSYLCSGRQVPCSVRAGALREGQAATIMVTGRPNATVEIQVFRLDVTGDRVTAMTALTKNAPSVTLDSRGYGRVSYPMAAFPTGEAGWGLVSLADTRWEDPDQIVGTIVSLQGRAPLVLGDGYGLEKPAGAVLDLEFVNNIRSTQFAVEYLADDGNWRNVSQSQTETADDPPVGVVRYQIPNGLLPKQYRFRLHNITDTGAADREWPVRPVVSALPQARAAVFRGPTLGGAVVSSDSTGMYRSPRIVQTVAGAGIGIGLVALVTWPAGVIAARRVRSSRP